MGHTVTVDELHDWICQESWRIFASAACGRSKTKRKRLEVGSNGNYRVSVGDDVKYLGKIMGVAVQTYNDLP